MIGALFLIARWIPRIIATIFAATILLVAASDAARETDPSLFLIGVGNLLSANDAELNDNMEKLKGGEVTAAVFFGTVGNVLLLYYILMILSWFFKVLIPFSSEASYVPWIIAIIILFLIQTIFNTAQAGELMLGFTGLANFLLNLGAFFAPIQPYISGIGEVCVKSPFC